MKEKLSIINGKPSFKRKCTYGSDGDWELHVYTRPHDISRDRFDKDCKPDPKVKDLGSLTMAEMLDRLHVYIGTALGSRDEPSAELAGLLAPRFDKARVLVDDGNSIVITAETGKDFYLFRYSTS
ncbi:MAG: hypothetical protein JW839_15735 [Candidatus Lokiarchaeota archaeon]|nr:hypothetical protein [Candidatus Lokiarchaeota archaeon]